MSVSSANYYSSLANHNDEEVEMVAIDEVHHPSQGSPPSSVASSSLSLNRILGRRKCKPLGMEQFQTPGQSTSHLLLLPLALRHMTWIWIS
jgi:hypothetical protein